MSLSLASKACHNRLEDVSNPALIWAPQSKPVVALVREKNSAKPRRSGRKMRTRVQAKRSKKKQNARKSMTTIMIPLCLIRYCTRSVVAVVESDCDLVRTKERWERRQAAEESGQKLGSRRC